MAKAMGRRGQKDQREVTANMANMATTFAHNAHFIKKKWPILQQHLDFNLFI